MGKKQNKKTYRSGFPLLLVAFVGYARHFGSCTEVLREGITIPYREIKALTS